MFVVLAHLLYDFHWQGAYISEMKCKSDLHLFVHALTWALLISVVLYLFNDLSLWKLWFLFGTHFIIDRSKARYNAISLETDQLLHLATLVVVSV